ncbi:Hint domain-containing protein [Planktotalea sp.]|uniref:Hint domain-containing protein n=1 Tax=Planktotalea sp. TaxID=2029877 RepID=UPI003D6A3419
MARISELHYSNAYAASSGVSEFLEVALNAGEDPADFTVSFYEANGTVGIEIPLTHPDVQTSIDPDNGEQIFVISADFFPIYLTDPNGGGSGNYEAYALVNTDTSTVVDFYDIGGGTQNIVAVDGLAAGATSENLPVVVGPNSTTTTLQFNQPDPDTLVYEAVNPGDSGLACFTKGTMIDTPNRPVAIETLCVGDLVSTIDNGACAVRWIGQTKVDGTGEYAPIRIRKGTLGATKNILVSPQHRILIEGWQSELLFGLNEILVPAKALINGETVERVSRNSVTYVHVMFESHQLVTCSGFVSESFFPGHEGLLATSQMAKEIRDLFPESIAFANSLIGLARPVEQSRVCSLLQAA